MGRRRIGLGIAVTAGLLLGACRSPTIPEGSGVATGPIRQPAIVSVYAWRPQGILGRNAQGTGFFITPTRIVTNWHVVENAASATVRLADGTDIDVTGVEAEDRAADLVVLQVEADAGTPKPLGVSGRELPIGEDLRIVGSPLGSAQTVVDGRVGSQRVAFDVLDEAVLLSAKADPGMSGSPVLDDRGHVVGVLSRGTNAEGQSFVVPASRITAMRIHDPQPLVLWSTIQRQAPGRNGEVTFSQATLAFEAGQFPQAIDLLDRARMEGLSPIVEATSWYVTGDAHVNLGRLAEAEPAYMRAIEMRPRHAVSLAALGQLRRRTGRPCESVDAYRRAVHLMPAMAPFHIGHGWALLQCGNAKAGYDAFRLALQLDEAAADAWTGAAACCLAEGKTGDARIFARRATTLREDLDLAWIVHARACMKERDWPAAVASYRTGCALRPHDHQARYEYGTALLRVGDRRGAQACLQILQDAGSPLAASLAAALHA